ATLLHPRDLEHEFELCLLQPQLPVPYAVHQQTECLNYERHKHCPHLRENIQQYQHYL
uniref:Uncharacterized protein n=1 Tax=Ciona intestinalis TaxID=7719 RepID=H2XU37_CIOIN